MGKLGGAEVVVAVCRHVAFMWIGGITTAGVALVDAW
jgi:hypothetical protein